MRKSLALSLAIAGAAAWSCGARQVPPSSAAALALERIIELPGVSDRIDHLAYDPVRRRLFVAEIANGTVDAIDLQTRGRFTVGGLHEPQGVAWLERAQELAVASGDGSVSFYAGDGLRLAARVLLGDDADDVRIDPDTGNVVVGYGSGGLATIDPATHRIVARLPLPSHPEGFSLSGDSAYVNVPNAGRVVLADRRTGRISGSWGTGFRRLNFPIAFDPGANWLAVGFRLPATLVLMDAGTGRLEQALGTCGDTDDLYFDSGRQRLYVVCGSGSVDVFRRVGGSYTRESRVISRPGARTGLFDPQADRLFVAAPARGARPAAILVYRPVAP